MTKWIPCNGGFIEADVVRWKEAVWEKRGRSRKARLANVGERVVTGEIVRDAGDGWVLVLVRRCEVVSEKPGRRIVPLPKGHELRRKRWRQRKHGTQFHATDLQSIQPGMSQEQVRTTLGTPSTSAVVGDGKAFYYISSTMGQSSFFAPTERDRQVVAVYFDQGGTVQNVANYGLKDGKVFDTISRTTPAPGSRDEGLIKGLFKNLGTKQVFGDGY